MLVGFRTEDPVDDKRCERLGVVVVGDLLDLPPEQVLHGLDDRPVVSLAQLIGEYLYLEIEVFAFMHHDGSLHGYSKERRRPAATKVFG